MDRIEHIKELQEKEFVTTRKQSIIVNNFFSLISIIIISIAIILYVNYVIPAQESKEKRRIAYDKKQDFLELRAKQIALSHKLNSLKKVNNGTK